MIRSVPDEILNKKEMARELKVSVPTLDKLRREGLPTEQWGLRAVRFKRQKVLQWLDERSDALTQPLGSMDSTREGP